MKRMIGQKRAAFRKSFVALLLALVLVFPSPVLADSEELAGALEAGLDKTIFLDLRDINVVDVFKFLAVQGNLNIVTSKNVQGRSTLLLKDVKIRDALDILVISNQLAYETRGDIIYIMTEDEYTLGHGKSFNDKKKVAIRQLKTAKPSYVLATLQAAQSALGKIIIDEDTGTVVMIDTPEKLLQMNAILDQVEKKLETQVIKLEYAKAEDVVAQLKPQLEGKGVGTVFGDSRSNQIVLSAYPDRLEQAMALVKSLDRQIKAVLIEARIIQIVLNPQYNFGIDWEKAFPSHNFHDMTFDTVLPINTATTTGGSLGTFKIGTMPPDNFNVTLQAMKEVKSTKVLANPRVQILDREEAKINIGDRLPYIVTTSTGTGNNVSISEDIRFIDVGVTLAVTPTLNDKGFVSMKIRPEISYKTGDVISGFYKNQIPIVNTTFVESTVIVQDGVSVILGGLIRDEQSETTKGIPYLMDIPYLGNMFKSRQDSNRKTEIVVVITPHIVTGAEDVLDEPIPIKRGKALAAQATQGPPPDLDMFKVKAFASGEKTPEKSEIPPPQATGGAGGFSAFMQKIIPFKKAAPSQ